MALGPDQGGQEGDQAPTVERGVVAGDRQPGSARPGDHSERRPDSQVEAGDQFGDGERVAIHDHGLRRRTRVPGLPVQARPDHRHYPV
jgi:hypothetical protein